MDLGQDDFPTATAEDAPGDSYFRGLVLLGNPLARSEPILDWSRGVLRGASEVAPHPRGEAWDWTLSTVLEGGSVLTGDLMGWVEGHDAFWTARITVPANGVYDDRLFIGRSRVDGTSGDWHIYAVASSVDREMGAVEWTHPGPEAWTVRLTEMGTLHSLEGGIAEYRVLGGTRMMKYTAFFYSFLDPVTSVSWIDWDAAQRSGSASSSTDGRPRECWGTRLQDVVCPG